MPSMPQVMRLKPAVPGTVVRDPLTREPLPPDGAEVQMTTYWLRRLAQGDVVQAAAEPNISNTTEANTAGLRSAT